jgi:hypothetical protein
VAELQSTSAAFNAAVMEEVSRMTPEELRIFWGGDKEHAAAETVTEHCYVPARV